MMQYPLKVLTSDSVAGLVAGAFTIALSPLLTVWYAWPEGFALYIGIVNVAYGCYSGTLAVRLRRQAVLSRDTLIALVIANSVWAGQCFTQAWWLRDSASFLGLGILIFEGCFVAGLAFLEARIGATPETRAV